MMLRWNSLLTCVCDDCIDKPSRLTIAIEYSFFNMSSSLAIPIVSFLAASRGPHVHGLSLHATLLKGAGDFSSGKSS